MAGFAMHPGQVVDTGTAVQGFTSRATALTAHTADADAKVRPFQAWGVFGYVLPLHEDYANLSTQFHEHLKNLGEAFDQASGKLVTAGEQQQAIDDLVAQSLVTIGGTMDEQHPAEKRQGWLTRVTANPANLVENKAFEAPPVTGPGFKLLKDLVKSAEDGLNHDGLAMATDVNQLLADGESVIVDASNIRVMLADPLGTLINKGLGFLIEVLAPLKTAIDMVTGDPQAVSDAAGAFDTIAKDLLQIAGDFETVLTTGLRNWTDGPAKEKAAEYLGRLHDGIEGTGGTAGSIAVLLQLASVLMQAAEDFVKGVVSEVVETILVACAGAALLAVPTGGVSIAGASTKAAQEVTSATTKIGRFLERIGKIARGILRIWHKLIGKLTRGFFAKGAKGGEVFKEIDEGKHLLQQPLTKLAGIARQQLKKTAGMDPTNLAGKDRGLDYFKIATKTVDTELKLTRAADYEVSDHAGESDAATIDADLTGEPPPT